MIKCKVTLAGVVNKAATTHAGKDNKPFVTKIEESQQVIENAISFVLELEQLDKKKAKF